MYVIIRAYILTINNCIYFSKLVVFIGHVGDVRDVMMDASSRILTILKEIFGIRSYLHLAR